MRFFEYSASILPILIQAMGWTLALTFVSAFFGTLVGLIVALARISRSRLLGALTTVYLTLFRGTPLLLQILFVYNALPRAGILLDSFTSASIALSLNAGAYIAEIIRAGIQSIDKGQMEAARSLGMSYGESMRRIILPQTYRRLIPPMVNEMAALCKDTSLASVVGLVELMRQSNQFISRHNMPWETYVWTAAGYLIVTVSLMTLATRLEKRLEARE